MPLDSRSRNCSTYLSEHYVCEFPRESSVTVPIPSHPSWMFFDFPFTGGLAWVWHDMVRDEVVHRTGQSIGWIPGWILLRQCSSPIKSTEQLEDRGRWLVIFCCYSRGLGQIQGWYGIGLWIPRTAAVAASNVERAFPINTSAGKYTDRLDDVDWWTGGA